MNYLLFWIHSNPLPLPEPRDNFSNGQLFNQGEKEFVESLLSILLGNPLWNTWNKDCILVYLHFSVNLARHDKQIYACISSIFFITQSYFLKPTQIQNAVPTYAWKYFLFLA